MFYVILRLWVTIVCIKWKSASLVNSASIERPWRMLKFVVFDKTRGNDKRYRTKKMLTNRIVFLKYILNLIEVLIIMLYYQSLIRVITCFLLFKIKLFSYCCSTVNIRWTYHLIFHYLCPTKYQLGQLIRPIILYTTIYIHHVINNWCIMRSCLLFKLYQIVNTIILFASIWYMVYRKEINFV